VRTRWLRWLVAVVLAGGVLGCDGGQQKGKAKDLDMPKPADAKEKPADAKEKPADAKEKPADAKK
jgi:hypothetical protein